MGGTMLQTERTDYIFNELNKNRVINVKQLAIDLQSSESTIRRDLIELEREGRLVRVHGGAILGQGQRVYNEAQAVQISDRMHINEETKIRICKYVSSMINDHQCVFIDGGSSLEYLAEELSQRDLKIVTNSALFLNRLNHARAEVLFLGGTYLDKHRLTMGPVAMEELARFNFDACFISCTGISFENEMSYTAELGTAVIKQLAIRQSLHSYLVLDDSKIEMLGFCNIASLNKFDGIICNKAEDVSTSLTNIIWV